MANGVPIKGDKLSAKVQMFFFNDPQCTVPVAPGNALKGGIIVPTRLAGEEIGTFTGLTGKTKDGSTSYQVDWIFNFRVYPAWPQKAFNSINQVTSYVKGTEVTGFWDTGVDAPKVPEVDDTGNAPDYTNVILMIAIGFALFKKYILPKLNRK